MSIRFHAIYPRSTRRLLVKKRGFELLRRAGRRLGWLLLGAACSGEKHPSAGQPSAAPPSSVEVLPVRAEGVAEADRLAVEGSRLSGAAGAEKTLRAARLRERLWRHDHKRADGLEAVELYRTVARSTHADACDSELSAALLEAEIGDDAEQAYKDIYRVQTRTKDGVCRQRASKVLATLSAYQPPPSELRTIDAEGGAAPPPGAPKPVASVDQVVSPHHTQVPDKPASITRIEPYGAEDSARVVVFVTNPTLFKVGVLEAQEGRGPRLFVDVQRASYKGKAQYDAQGLLQRVRLGAQGDATRVVLDLAAPVYHRVFYLPEPFRLVVDVSKTPLTRPETSAAGRRNLQRVVLDPGHGGHDPGATGPTGLREKDVTLDIAHRAAPLVARELSISTLLTRDTDDFIPLDERTARANAFRADLFISIHTNASEDSNSTGIMTFVLDESKDALASRVAARENAASPAAAVELANAMSRVLDAGALRESVHFAELLQRSALASLRDSYGDVRDRGVRRAGFYVLAGAQMPAVLYEASFISNPRGEMRLNTANYRQKMADAIVNAVRAYRDGL